MIHPILCYTFLINTVGSFNDSLMRYIIIQVRPKMLFIDIQVSYIGQTNFVIYGTGTGLDFGVGLFNQCFAPFRQKLGGPPL